MNRALHARVAVAVPLLFLVSCQHRAQEPPEKIVSEKTGPVCVDGMARYQVVGDVVDASTGAPISGAWVTFTDLGGTFSGADPDRTPYRQEPRQAGRSDAAGHIDLTFERGIEIEMAFDPREGMRNVPLPNDIEQCYNLVEPAWLKLEVTVCVDVSKAGYRTWARVYTDEDCEWVDGRTLINIGRIELERIPE
ncbi:MAG: hypothetical protein IT364_09405 [Candidatus Hydrogenedentes bacterium]|nr:hypothetical protein [Candidatus Hydrogenedentota bacterium]